MSFEIVANYQKHSYSHPSQASNDLVANGAGSYSYPRDLARAFSGWTYRPLNITSFDDSYSNDPIDLGMTWGWADSLGNAFTTTNWWLNTNGVMMFGNLSGDITPGVGTQGIAANPADLWFQPGVVNNTNAYVAGGGGGTFARPSWDPALQEGVNSQYQDTTIAQFQSFYYITVVNDGGYCKFTITGNSGSDSGGVAWFSNPVIEIKGYTVNGTYYAADANTFNVNSTISQQPYYNTSVGNNRFGAPIEVYGGGLRTNIPYSGLNSIRLAYFGQPAPTNFTHGLWDHKFTWVENGISHYMYKCVVYCGSYGTKTHDHSYRISLYKSGTQQKFSISLADEKTRRLKYGIINGASTDRQAGPYPMAASDTTLTAYTDWREQSWYSENNGVTWYRYVPTGNNWWDQPTFSTVVQMRTPAPNFPQYNKTISVITSSLPTTSYGMMPYGAASAGQLENQQMMGNQYNLSKTPGQGLITALTRILNNLPARDIYEQVIYDLLNQGIDYGYKTPAVYYNKDINYDGTFDANDITQAQYFINGQFGQIANLSRVTERLQNIITQFNTSWASTTYLGYTEANKVAYTATGYSAGGTAYDILEFKKYCVQYGFITSTGNKWSTAWDNKWILPGVKAIPPTKINLSTLMYAGVGSLEQQTIVPLDSTYVLRTGGALSDQGGSWWKA